MPENLPRAGLDLTTSPGWGGERSALSTPAPPSGVPGPQHCQLHPGLGPVASLLSQTTASESEAASFQFPCEKSLTLAPKHWHGVSVYVHLRG